MTIALMNAALESFQRYEFRFWYAIIRTCSNESIISDMNFPAVSLPSYPNLELFGHQIAHQKQLLASPTPDIDTVATQSAPPLSPIHKPSPSSQQLPRYQEKSSPPSDAAPDPIIGHVLASKKFSCSSPECAGSTFNRQADFRRHYNEKHVSLKIEHFCPFAGCQRSAKPSGGKSKRRSFGGRKDKMKEHIRNQHKKVGRKRKMTMPDEDEEDEEEDDDDDESLSDDQVQRKTRRRRH
ncbi:hypothetical protein P153DRAFT_380262 [Dothidotthia symphoricarpi CBS 119687]|uniref:C2H2-type domain-containing protein n=1 Tax=Dothidotthia symphoricarpi CBS 119687 TaxID=1392245 RepID=A0A6A6AU08_9PLEO|nr:uncharacterized protein P153DRAFT_380262 [Dothidotthia symphoricarpi CBS 119687]KAF2134445.1 hypothetical protein P153DRAFT_380262 [Dothidotthia symphoricarpi CBS 119687]